MLSSEFIIRPATAADLNMVYSYWIDAHRDQVLDIPRNWYRPLYRRLLQRLIHDFPVQLSVVSLARVPNQVLAFIAYEPDPAYLHFVFTKKIYRRHGIADALVDHAFAGKPFKYTMKPASAGREMLSKYTCRPSYRYIQREYRPNP